MQTKGFKKQLPSNLITNAIYFVINIIIGVWLVPFYIRKLGIEAYGFIQLATQITFFATFITLSLNSSVARFLTLDIQNNKIQEANKTFNTAIIISLVIILTLLPFAFSISYFADHIFTIPVALIRDSKFLFFIVFLSFLITVLSNPFTASTTSQNRLDLSNIINIINVVVRTGLVVFLLYILTPSLTSVGFSFLIAALVTLVVSYFICKKISPELKFKVGALHVKPFKPFPYYDKSRVGSLTDMSVWLIINQVGTILFINFDLILINWVFKDSAMQGKYAALLQMSILLRNLSFIISRVTGPMIYISYAKNEIKKIVSIMCTSVKFMGIVLAFPIGIMCGFAYPFLNVWLGQEYTKYVYLLWLITIPLIINLGVQPLYSIANAYYKVKIPGIVTLILGLVNVLFAVILAKNTNLGLYAIALASAVVLTLKNIIFTTIYSSYVISSEKLNNPNSELRTPNSFTFMKPVFTGLLLMLLIFAASYSLSQFISIHSWFSLLFYSVVVSLPFLPLIWYYVIVQSERDTLKSIIIKVFDR